MVSNVSKSFGGQTLFKGAFMRVEPKERVAIVGPNGSGKTTLFEMFAGADTPDSGIITITPGTALGYLAQETDRLRGATVLNEVMAGRPLLESLAARLARLEIQMAEHHSPTLMREYGEVQHEYEAHGGYAIEHEAKAILAGLGFKPGDEHRLTDTYSGGWMMRIALAKLLVARPDLLLLDEPTNHLDLASVEWLEKFLASYGGTVVFTSHDREFINGFANKIVEVRDRRLFEYSGDYDDFVLQRELSIRQAAMLAKQQQKKIESTTRFIERFRYKKTKARQVQSRIRALEKMERVEVPFAERRAMNLRFPTPARIGRVAVELEGVRFAYDYQATKDQPNWVFDGLKLELEGSWKVALVGPNGAGKTTLLKLIAGVLDPISGNRRLGQSARVGYFAQHQIEALDQSKTVIAEMETVLPPAGAMKARDLLGRFLFSGDDVFKKVSVLSGGEKTRLAMAKMLASKSNFLCLDEPTNHLDMQSRDVVGEALGDFPGSMVLITHDRNLIREVANVIVEVIAGEVTVFHGDYDYYLSKKAVAVGTATGSAPSKGETTQRNTRPRHEVSTRHVRSRSVNRVKQLEGRLLEVERRIADLGREADEMATVLADSSTYSRGGEEVAELVRRYEATARKIKHLEKQWEETALELESADS